MMRLVESNEIKRGCFHSGVGFPSQTAEQGMQTKAYSSWGIVTVNVWWSLRTCRCTRLKSLHPKLLGLSWSPNHQEPLEESAHSGQQIAQPIYKHTIMGLVSGRNQMDLGGRGASQVG